MDQPHVLDIFNEIPVVLVPVIFEEYQDEKLVLSVDFFEYLLEYGVIRILFTIENAARINLIFRLANLLVVSLLFGLTIECKETMYLKFSVIGTVCFG